jgi:pimeloyl-ACP methyl ester carboxylesterase
MTDEPVLLLHGQPGGAGDWDRVRAAIGTRTPTLAIDRPGWDGHRAPANLEGNAEAALEALDAAGAERATVVGHSFGGAVAAWLAASHPQRVTALVLVSPAANCASLYRMDYLTAAPVAGYAASVATLGGLGLSLTAGPVRRRLAAALGLDDRYLQAAARVLRTPGAWRAYAAEQRVLVDDLPALEAQLKRITAPTTIVAGTADWVVPRVSVRRLAEQIETAELILVADAGHLLPQQAPERLADLIVAASSGG